MLVTIPGLESSAPVCFPWRPQSLYDGAFSVHRAGITFPELPYGDLLETEAFGKWANDMGINPIGLPQVEIQHVNE